MTATVHARDPVETSTEPLSASSYRFGSLLLVFPIPRLARRYPFHRLRYAALPGFLALGFRDPFDVLALMTGAKRGKGSVCLLAFFERGQEVGRNSWNRLL